MKAGRPGTSLPTPMTVSRDIKAAFECCRERIDTILKVGLRICIAGCVFNRYIGTLRTYTFCDQCVDFPKSPGLCCLDGAFAPLRKDLGIFT
jgi:hypothetical protein